jgi:hypothetical protein
MLCPCVHGRNGAKSAAVGCGVVLLTSAIPRKRRAAIKMGPVVTGPGRVKTLRGITAPGILRLVVTLRAKKCKKSSSAQRYNQIRFRFHTAEAINRTRAVHSITCRARWSADADDQNVSRTATVVQPEMRHRPGSLLSCGETGRAAIWRAGSGVIWGRSVEHIHCVFSKLI